MSSGRRRAGTGRRPVLAIALVSLLLAPAGSAAQTPGKVSRIGMLETSTAARNAENLEAFRQVLASLGYIEGRNLVVEYRSADRGDDFRELAAELVRLPVDVIVTRSTPAALAAKQATRTIPIVMASSGDPVATGLVPSLAHPGGNVTGISSLTPTMAGKRLELLREALPGLSRVAVLWNPGNPAAATAWKETRTAAQALGMIAVSLEIRKAGDIELAFDVARRQRANVLLVIQDPVTQNQHRQIIGLARRHQLPDAYASREFAEGGGLLAYGPSYPDLYRRAATYVDRILKGARPADLPIEQPTTFELVVNLRTARALGVTIPPAVLLRADRVIE